MKKILITGGAGFIGHHLVEHVLLNTDWNIIVLDKLTYASYGFDRLKEIQAYPNSRVQVFTADFTQEMGLGLRREVGEVDYLVHLAAETHVDNSITYPWDFIQANLVGTFRILELARSMSNLEKMIYFSTDEVFGPAKDGESFREWDRYNSTNPYSATKAGGEELCLAWANTFEVPVMISHTMNAFGERQHPEKFVPLVVRKVLRDEPVFIHADKSKTKSGSRFYIHAWNISAAVLFLLEKGQPQDKYNICGEMEVSNLEMAKTIAGFLNKELKYEMVDYHSARPGHDLRYALDGDKMRKMGWAIPIPFESSLSRTLRWIANPQNSRWLKEVAEVALL